MKVQHVVADLGLKAMSRTHELVLRLSGGKLLSTTLRMPVVELRTTGRRSGKTRTTMLTAPIVDGERVVLVASKGGDDRNPDWYQNIVANPVVQLTIAGERRGMRARTASSEEKADLWPRIVSAYKGYDGYRRRTERDIPVVVCEPL